MFIVLVRRCQEVWPIGRHGPMTSEWETKQFGCPSLFIFLLTVSSISVAIIVSLWSSPSSQLSVLLSKSVLLPDGFVDVWMVSFRKNTNNKTTNKEEKSIKRTLRATAIVICFLDCSTFLW